MDEEEVEASTAPLQTLADGGHFITISDDSDPLPGRLPVVDIAAPVALAQTAVQPGTLGGAAFTEVSYYMTVDEHETIVAELVARIEGLEAIIGGSIGGAFAEEDVFEEELFA